MINGYSIPSLTAIGLLFGGSISSFGIAGWLIAKAEADSEISSFLLLLAGMVLLVIALVLLALRVMNQRHGTTPPDA